MTTNSKGFILLEIIVTIVIMAIIMLIMGTICVECVRATAYGDSLTYAFNFARAEMATVNLTAYTDLTIGDSTTQNPLNLNFDIRRTVSSVNSALKLVEVRVFPHNNTTNTLADVYTYVMDVKTGIGGWGRDAMASYCSFHGGIPDATGISNIYARWRYRRMGEFVDAVRITNLTDTPITVISIGSSSYNMPCTIVKGYPQTLWTSSILIEGEWQDDWCGACWLGTLPNFNGNIGLSRIEFAGPGSYKVQVEFRLMYPVNVWTWSRPYTWYYTSS